ncbi:TetR family transcriptional regulator [Streptomonospora litoralis]|uniref:HTH-type transcriptional repressor NicS n=1 Tax=Streptomonospora litoralis TaxID=2498135 RepID=A0A4P6Q0V4_9ACTN|nr:TetR family transcriptional regulator [Streptomonospora litoralis]QBI52324.1 HTH-type transcriptional repressor NicS [Streptomonospora litoralis]
MPPDSDASKARILRAAAAEFAEHGISGARVNRIAQRANANKQLIYAYFGDKETLFDIVLRDRLAALAEDVPLDPADLPGYAGEVFDYILEHPELARLSGWELLERDGACDTGDRRAASYRAKVAAVAEAQRRGLADPHTDPVHLLALLLALAATWLHSPYAVRALDEDGAEATRRRRREVVVEAARRVVAPPA